MSEPTMVVLYKVPDLPNGQVILGTADGELLILSRYSVDSFPPEWLGVLKVISTDRPNLVVYIPPEPTPVQALDVKLWPVDDGRDISFKQEQIELKPVTVGGWRTICGYGPKSKTWAVSRRRPVRVGAA